MHIDTEAENQLKHACDTLGINNRNIAYILGVSEWYVGKLLDEKKMSKRMRYLFTNLAAFLQQHLEGPLAVPEKRSACLLAVTSDRE